MNENRIAFVWLNHNEPNKAIPELLFNDSNVETMLFMHSQIFDVWHNTCQPWCQLLLLLTAQRYTSRIFYLHWWLLDVCCHTWNHYIWIWEYVLYEVTSVACHSYICNSTLYCKNLRNQRVRTETGWNHVLKRFDNFSAWTGSPPSLKASVVSYERWEARFMLYFCDPRGCDNQMLLFLLLQKNWIFKKSKRVTVYRSHSQSTSLQQRPHLYYTVFKLNFSIQIPAAMLLRSWQITLLLIF